jgi:nicotinate-nucleotide adenylyltransferase
MPVLLLAGRRKADLRVATAHPPKDADSKQILKLGFFGGSFDPVHLGHLIAAQDAHEQLELDSLFFVPAAQAPLRDANVHASAADRVALLERALAGDSRFQILDWEIERGGVSYTFDTVARARCEFPNATLIWIIGEDQVAKLPGWHRLDELCAMTDFAFLQRPGHTLPSIPDLPNLRLHRLISHQVELSSSEIRQRTLENRPLRFLLPDPVIEYIQQRSLFT